MDKDTKEKIAEMKLIIISARDDLETAIRRINRVQDLIYKLESDIESSLLPIGIPQLDNTGVIRGYHEIRTAENPPSPRAIKIEYHDPFDWEEGGSKKKVWGSARFIAPGREIE
jgi:hypothetical protein